MSQKGRFSQRQSHICFITPKAVPSLIDLAGLILAETPARTDPQVTFAAKIGPAGLNLGANFSAKLALPYDSL